MKNVLFVFTKVSYCVFDWYSMTLTSSQLIMARKGLLCLSLRVIYEGLVIMRPFFVVCNRCMLLFLSLYPSDIIEVISHAWQEK